MLVKGFSIEKEALCFGHLFIYEELLKLEPNYKLELHEVITAIGKFEYISMVCIKNNKKYGINFEKMEIKVMYPTNEGLPICVNNEYKTLKLSDYLEAHDLIVKMIKGELGILEDDYPEESIKDFLEKESDEIIKVLKKNEMKYFKHDYDKYNDEIILNTGLNKISIKYEDVVISHLDKEEEINISQEEYFLIPKLIELIK